MDTQQIQHKTNWFWLSGMPFNYTRLYWKRYVSFLMQDKLVSLDLKNVLCVWLLHFLIFWTFFMAGYSSSLEVTAKNIHFGRVRLPITWLICNQVPEGENHTLLARRDELNATMMEQGCTRDMDKWGTVWSQVNRQTDKQTKKVKETNGTNKELMNSTKQTYLVLVTRTSRDATCGNGCTELLCAVFVRLFVGN